MRVQGRRRVVSPGEKQDKQAVLKTMYHHMVEVNKKMGQFKL